MGEEKRNQEYASSFSEDSVSPGRLKIFFGYAAGGLAKPTQCLRRPIRRKKRESML